MTSDQKSRMEYHLLATYDPLLFGDEKFRVKEQNKNEKGIDIKHLVVYEDLYGRCQYKCQWCNQKKGSFRNLVVKSIQKIFMIEHRYDRFPVLLTNKNKTLPPYVIQEQEHR